MDRQQPAPDRDSGLPSCSKKGMRGEVSEELLSTKPTPCQTPLRSPLRTRSRVLFTLLVVASLAAADVLYPAWDKLMVKPQAPLKPVASKGELALLLYHSYPDALHRLKIEVVPGEIVAGGDPVELAEALPTELNTVTLALKYQGVPSSDTAEAVLRFSADELAEPHDFRVLVPLTARGASEANQRLTLPVGEVPVIITPHGNLAFVLQMVLLVVLLVWWGYRKRRVQQQGKIGSN